MLGEYPNKYTDNFASNQILINESMSFNSVPENLEEGKIPDPYLRELSPEHNKYVCLNLYKTLNNLQRIVFVYGSLKNVWTAMEAEKKPSVAGEGETNPLFEMSKLFDQVILTVCSYHVTYVLQSESALYSCLNVKELLARNRRDI